MSSYVSIDHPDEVIHWFKPYPADQRSRTAVGPCPHDCEHRNTSVVGYGSDLDHYELVTCDDVCDGNCRAWIPTDDNAHGGTHGPVYRLAMRNPDMRLLGDPPDEDDDPPLGPWPVPPVNADAPGPLPQSGRSSGA